MSFGFLFFLMVQSDNEGNIPSVMMRTLGDMNHGGETFLDTESYDNPN